MSEQLDETQIEALFGGQAGSGAPGARRTRLRRRVRTVDFSRPNTFSKEQERRMRRAHEAFCRNASTALSGEARTPVDFEVLDVRQLTWANAVRETESDTIFAVIRLGADGAQLVMALERVFVLTLIERMCGGADTGPANDRKLTEVDAVLTEGVMRALIDQLSLVWNQWFDVSAAFEALEVDTRGIQVAQLAEPTVLITIEAWLARHTFLLTLMLPHAAVKQASATFLAREAAARVEDPQAAGAMRRALGAVAIELRARVASREITAADLLAVKVGDVVSLGAAGPVTLYADEVAVHRGRPGRDGGKRAIQIGESSGL
ncbi:MAG: FliM/FliN family flagellar motor switch protein [Solirubrobacteraceae bacterium]|jgi:flagellar motor switch protein FliM